MYWKRGRAVNVEKESHHNKGGDQKMNLFEKQLIKSEFVDCVEVLLRYVV